MPFGARIYYRNIVDRFLSAPKFLARRLAEADWARANRLGFSKFNGSVADPLESERMDLDSSASGLSFDRPTRGSDIRQPESSMKEVNRLLPESGRPAQGKVCLVCNRTFRQRKQLKCHQKRMRSRTGKFRCPQCSSTFDTEDTL